MIVFVLYLLIESIRLRSNLRKIPLRICITGIRGKSGVTRLIAASLQKQGRRVLAKTTGSKPMIIFPEGKEREILRAGPASIREQIRLVALAAQYNADVLVAEMMGISEECLSVESRGILRPDFLVLTNVRPDHLETMGPRQEDIARSLAASIPEGKTVVIPRDENRPVFEQAASSRHSRLVVVDAAESIDESRKIPTFRAEVFQENICLALDVLRLLGLDDETALQGMNKAVPDFGALRIFRGDEKTVGRSAYLISAFAANDPESTSAVIDKALAAVPAEKTSKLGLLCLREDRADRTLQWIRAAEEGYFQSFDRVGILGETARPALRKLRKRQGPGHTTFFSLSSSSPEEVTREMIAHSDDNKESIIFGLGNIVGHGERILHFWEQIGRPYDY